MKEPRMTAVFFDTVWKNNPGFYVEIGAWDGKKKNSTIILEQAGWSGVCIEASPLSYQQLIQNRKCRCLNIAVYNYEGEVDYALFPNRPEWNGIVESYDSLHRRLLENSLPAPNTQVLGPAEIIKIPCKSWNTLEFPTHIDYLQLDVEGAELAILKCIDWTKQQITYICLEDNAHHHGDNTYYNYMTALGYICIKTQGVDFLWYKE
jgi:FkbM family methyltransferase